MNEEMLDLEGLEDLDLEGLEEEGEMEGLGELSAAIRQRARMIRQRRSVGKAPTKTPQLVSADVVRSIREVIKTDFYDTVYYDGASEIVPFFVDPIGKRHKVYRRDGSTVEYAKTQAETNIRKPNELEIAQQLKVLGVSLAIYTSTAKVNTDANNTNNLQPEEAFEIIGDTLFRIKVGETERFAVPTRHIPSGSDLYGQEVVTRGVPNSRNFYGFGKNAIVIKVGETFRPEIVFQQNTTAAERARLEGVKLALRFHTIFARPVA